MAKKWSGQMLQDSWAGYESYSGMSEYQSDFFYAKLVHTYHVNLISSEDTPTHYSRKLPVTNVQKSHDQSLPFHPRILPDHVVWGREY